MNVKSKKALALTLVLLTLSLSFCGCSSKGGESASETDERAETSAESSETRQSKAQTADELSFGGLSIDFLTRGVSRYDGEITVVSENGDVVNDAVFERDNRIEEQYDVVLTETRTADDDWHGPIGTLEPLILAGDDIYEVAASSMSGIMSYTANAGYFVNLNKLSYLELGESYWSQLFNEAASIGDAQYAATGSLSLSLYRMVWLTYFNSRLADEFIGDDLFEVVRGGSWTIDRLSEYTKDVYSDLDGDNERDENDLYGLAITVQNTPDAFYASCNISLCGKNEKNEPYFNVDTDKINTVVKKLNTLVWDSVGTIAFDGDHSFGVSQYDYNNQFTNGQSVFFMARAMSSESAEFRNMIDGYGLLPIPKYDEAQTTYYSYAHNPYTVFVIPFISANSEATGAVLNGLARDSEETVVRKYYDVALSTKYINDESSKEMLDIAFANILMDPAQIFIRTIGELPSRLLTFQIRQNTDTVASTYAEYIDSATLNLDSIIALYNAAE